MRLTPLSVGTFVGAVTLATVAGSFRFGDSGHAIGVVSQTGGKVGHPLELPGGLERYALIVTATVLPPYRGDARVAIEGDGSPLVSMHASEPVVDLGIRRRPRFRDGVFRDLRPGDHLALWIRLKAPKGERLGGRYRITFRDTAAGRVVLEVPLILSSGEEGSCHVS